MDLTNMADTLPNIEDVKKELFISTKELMARGLKISFQWSSNLLHSLELGNSVKPLARKIGYKKPKFNYKDIFECRPSVIVKPLDVYSIDNISISYEETEQYIHAHTCFGIKEYQRAEFWLKNCHSDIPLFVKYYSEFLAADDSIKNIGSGATDSMLCDFRNSVDKLIIEIVALRNENKADGYLLNLLGVLYVKSEQYELAVEALIESLHKVPINWGAWMALGDLIVDRSKLFKLKLPNHWMKYFFFCQKYLDLQINEHMLEIAQNLSNCGFADSIFLLSNMAVCYHNIRHIEMAILKFQELIEIEPFRLLNMDTYSNLLFVKNDRIELVYLAQRATKINKYCVETCCILGNYYSLHNERKKALRYFLRALKLNTMCLSAWTLLAQEHMELNNSNDAIMCYCKALEINKYEYRAWYGLGQTFEILGMFKHSLNFFKKAQLLRPFDSRMIIAVGNVYEKLGNIDLAFQCYLKGREMGDGEKMGLIYLAKLYIVINRPDKASIMFLEYIEEHGLDEQTQDHSFAYMFLANYYLSQSNYDQALYYAQKCLNYTETKEEAKALLKTIVHERVYHLEVDHAMKIISMSGEQRKTVNHDEEIPRQLERLSLTQNPEEQQKEGEDDGDDDDDDDDGEYGEGERLCNRITMYLN